MKIISMNLIIFILIAFTSNFSFTQTKNFAVKVESLSSEGEEKAITFRNIDSVTIEIWVTSSRSLKNIYSKALFSRLPNTDLLYSKISGLNQEIRPDKTTYDGSISFLNTKFDQKASYFVFVSNRLHLGKFYNNDLYEGYFTSSSSVTIRRLEKVNSEFWDDTPFLHPNGNILYFSSDRNHPGTGKVDIFMSTKLNGIWDTPSLVPNINTEQFSETSPSVSPDGKYLYFSTDAAGDYDIWFVELDENGRPVSLPKPLDESKFIDVNKKGSDEISPVVTPGGNFLFFCSNRDQKGLVKKDFDIFYIPLNLPPQSLDVDVKRQKITYIPSKELYGTQIEPATADINISSPLFNFRKNFKTSDQGLLSISIPRVINDDPLNDFRFRKFSLNISSQCHDGKTVNVVHTLKYDVLCSGPFNHNVRIWCEEAPPDTIPLPVDSIPFFITGYWCPSTVKYKDYTLCGSIANIINSPEIRLNTESGTCNCPSITDKLKFTPSRDFDELFNYYIEPKNLQPKLIKTRTNNLCIKLGEIDKAMNVWSNLVDSTLDEMIIQMEKILNYDFVRFEIERGGKVKIEVYGWTDWRPLDVECRYTGPDIDLSQSFIEVPKTARLYGKSVVKDYIKNGTIHFGQRFVGLWRSGNQLLSDLRAYYTADLLDKLWSENIPDYVRLKQNGVLSLIAIGRSVKNVPGALEYNRSIDVRFVVERSSGYEYHKRAAEFNPNIEIWICSPSVIANK